MTSTFSSTSNDNPRMINVSAEESKQTIKSLKKLLKLLGSINTSIQSTLEKHERETVAKAFCIASWLLHMYPFVTKETDAEINEQDARHLENILPTIHKVETLIMTDHFEFRPNDTKSDTKKSNARNISPRLDLQTNLETKKTAKIIEYDSSSKTKPVVDFVQTVDTNSDTKKMKGQEISPSADLEANPLIPGTTTLEYDSCSSSKPVLNVVLNVEKRSDTKKKISAPKNSLRLDLETYLSMPRKRIIRYEQTLRSKPVLKSIQPKDNIGKEAKQKHYANNGASSSRCFAEENNSQSIRDLRNNRRVLPGYESQESAPNLTDDHSSNHKLPRRLSLNQTSLSNVTSSHQLLFEDPQINKHPRIGYVHPSDSRKTHSKIHQHLPTGLSRSPLSPELDIDVVRRNFIYLKAEIDARKLADYMFQGNAFTFDDRKTVIQAPTKASANEQFFNLLMDNGTKKAFEEFKKALKKEYPHVAKVLVLKFPKI